MAGAGGRDQQTNLDDPEIVEQGSFTEINIVPLVDIMLVLLVILMATSTDIIQAGLSEGSGFRVNLPTGAETDEVASLSDELVVAILEDGAVVLNDRVVSPEELSSEFAEAAASNPNRMVLVQADERAFHRTVVRVMETAREAGLRNLAIATQPQE